MSRTGVFADTGGANYQFWAGVLRNTAGTWQILGYPGPADPTHQSSNLWTCSQDADSIYVTGPTSSKMVSFHVNVDETLAALGIFVGASVVSGKATIKMSIVDPTNTTTGVSALSPNDPRLVTEFGNLWLMGFFLV